MSSKEKKEDIYLLDTMVLINFTERCIKHDIFGYFEELNVRFQVVEEVKHEFFYKIKPLGEQRFEKYIKNNVIQIIDNDSIEIDVKIMNSLLDKGFGRGELFSALYQRTRSDVKLVSDESVVQRVFEKKFNQKVTRTYDLLGVLVDKGKITENLREEIIDEMIENGLWIKR